MRRAGDIGGGSLNDAFIAGVVGGLRRYHDKHVSASPRAHRDDADQHPNTERPGGGNRPTLMRFDLPAAIADPAQRIGVIHERTSKMRKEKSLAYTQPIAGALNLMPRWYVGSVLRNVDFVASDVPGLPIPVFLAGAAVRMQYAFGPTIGTGLNVTLLSYVDTWVTVRIEPPICRARRRWVNETSGADRRRVRAAPARRDRRDADRFRREKGRGSGLAAEALAAVCAALRAGGVDTLIVGELEDGTVVTGPRTASPSRPAPTCCPNSAKRHTEWYGRMRRFRLSR